MGKYKYAQKIAAGLLEKYDIKVSVMEADKTYGHATLLYKGEDDICALAVDKYHSLYKKIRKWDCFADDVILRLVAEDLQNEKLEYDVFYKGFDDFKEKLENNMQKLGLLDELEKADDTLPFYALYRLYKNGNYPYKKIWKKIAKKVRKETGIA